MFLSWWQNLLPLGIDGSRCRESCIHLCQVMHTTFNMNMHIHTGVGRPQTCMRFPLGSVCAHPVDTGTCLGRECTFDAYTLAHPAACPGVPAGMLSSCNDVEAGLYAQGKRQVHTLHGQYRSRSRASLQHDLSSLRAFRTIGHCLAVQIS